MSLTSKKVTDRYNHVYSRHHQYWLSQKQLLVDVKNRFFNGNPTEQLSNFNKVCKIRQIPEFYSLYFLNSIVNLEPNQQNRRIVKEIEEILAKKSQYFKISNKIEQRQLTISEMKKQVKILSAFEKINLGQSNIHNQNQIQEIFKDCQNLQQIKIKEEKMYKELAQNVKKNRTLTLELIELVQSWKRKMESKSPLNNKIKLLFLNKVEINILIVILYDTRFLSKSFLKKFLNFAEKHDPFFFQLLKQKPQNFIQDIFLKELGSIQNSENIIKIMYRLTEQLQVITITSDNWTDEDQEDLTSRVDTDSQISNLKIMKNKKKSEIIYLEKKSKENQDYESMISQQSKSLTNLKIQQLRQERKQLQLELKRQKKKQQNQAALYRKKINDLDREIEQIREKKQNSQEIQKKNEIELKLKQKQVQLKQLKNEFAKNIESKDFLQKTQGLKNILEQKQSEKEKKIQQKELELQALKRYMNMKNNYNSVQNNQQTKKQEVDQKMSKTFYDKKLEQKQKQKEEIQSIKQRISTRSKKVRQEIQTKYKKKKDLLQTQQTKKVEELNEQKLKIIKEYNEKLEKQRKQFLKQKQKLLNLMKQRQEEIIEQKQQQMLKKMQKIQKAEKQKIKKLQKQLEQKEKYISKQLEQQRRIRKQKQLQLKKQMKQKQKVELGLQIENLKEQMEKQLRQELEQLESLQNMKKQKKIKQKEIKKITNGMFQKEKLELEQLEEHNEQIRRLLNQIKSHQQQADYNPKSQIPQQYQYKLQKQLNEKAVIEDIMNQQLHLKLISGNEKMNENIQNLVEFYRKRPQQIQSMKKLKPRNQFKITLNKQSKEELVDNIVKNASKRQNFEEELLSLHKINSQHNQNYESMYYNSFLKKNLEQESEISDFINKYRFGENYFGQGVQNFSETLKKPKLLEEIDIQRRKLKNLDNFDKNSKNYIKLNRERYRKKDLESLQYQNEKKLLRFNDKLTNTKNQNVIRRSEDAIKKYISRSKSKQQFNKNDRLGNLMNINDSSKTKRNFRINNSQPKLRLNNNKDEKQFQFAEKTEEKQRVKMPKLKTEENEKADPIKIQNRIKSGHIIQRFKEYPKIQKQGKLHQKSKENIVVDQKQLSKVPIPQVKAEQQKSIIDDSISNGLNKQANQQQKKEEKKKSKRKKTQQKMMEAINQEKKEKQQFLEKIEQIKGLLKANNKKIQQTLPVNKQQNINKEKKKQQIPKQQTKQENTSTKRIDTLNSEKTVSIKNVLTSDQTKQNTSLIQLRNTIRNKYKLTSFIVYIEEIPLLQTNKYLNEYAKLIHKDIKLAYSFDIKKIAAIINQQESYHVLIAKDKNSIEKGLGLFHKQNEIYIADHINIHNINDLIEVIFNFSKFIFLNDVGSEKIEFKFNFNNANFQYMSIYQEFQQMCVEMGEVYAKKEQILQRKYIIKRSMFFDDDFNQKTQININKFHFNSKLYLNKQKFMMKNINNMIDDQTKSISMQILLTELLKSVVDQQEFQKLKKKVKTNVKLKELLITAVIMEKKQIKVDEIILKTYENLELIKSQCPEILNYVQMIPQNHVISTATFNHSFSYPTSNLKQCQLLLEEKLKPYLAMKVSIPIINITSESYNSKGYFLTLSNKHKIMFVQADEYLALNDKNKDFDLFFYFKHYLKNVKTIGKETYQYIFVPKVHKKQVIRAQTFRQSLQKDLFITDEINFGDKRLKSSIQYVPTHRDLVIKTPFLFCILSSTVQKVIEGTPIYGRLIVQTDIR